MKDLNELKVLGKAMEERANRVRLREKRIKERVRKLLGDIMTGLGDIRREECLMNAELLLLEDWMNAEDKFVGALEDKDVQAAWSGVDTDPDLGVPEFREFELMLGSKPFHSDAMRDFVLAVDTLCNRLHEKEE